jgi:hypothetical protein
MRITEIRQRQKQREEDRVKIMKQLADESKQRRKSYDQVEAPFKKIKEQAKGSGDDGNEEGLWLAIQAAKPAPFGALKVRGITAQDRQREIQLLMDLIREKREEVQRAKEAQAQVREDVVIIGSVEVPIDLPAKSRHQSEQPTPRSRVPEYGSLSAADAADLIGVTAFGKSLLDIPPSDDEGKPANGISASSETGFFIFTGLPLDIPGIQDVDKIEDRMDCLQQFLEQGLGSELTETAKNCVRRIGLGEAKPSEFGKVFSNRGLIAYFPFVQHYIFCEALVGS